jgi:hypothetical protein
MPIVCLARQIRKETVRFRRNLVVRAGLGEGRVSTLLSHSKFRQRVVQRMSQVRRIASGASR